MNRIHKCESPEMEEQFLFALRIGAIMEHRFTDKRYLMLGEINHGDEKYGTAVFLNFCPMCGVHLN